MVKLHMNDIGLIIGLLLLDKKLNKTFNKNSDKIYIIFVFSIVFGWIGAHVFDVIAKKQVLGHAGFTFLGGLIFGAAFFVIIFVRYYNTHKLLTALNVVVTPLILGHAIGRIGCYFSGCCYGTVIDHSNYLSLFFLRHPTQIYESIFLFLLFAFLNLKEKMQFQISNIYIYLVIYGVWKFLIEFLRGDYRGQHLGGLSPSQWISLFIIFCICLFLIIKASKKNLTNHSSGHRGLKRSEWSITRF